MDKARELRTMWDPSTFKFNPKLVRAYRNASEGSKVFNTRLIELVAVAVHQLAGQVYKMKLHLHQGDISSIVNWVMPKPADWSLTWCDIPARPTIFNHPGYLDCEIYPEHEADMVGYWAEDRILGGVVAFDRRAEETGTSAPPNVYFLSCRAEVTNRIYQLRDDQQNALLAFLHLEAATIPPESCPLPILADNQNRVRIDVYNAIMHHRVYRDIWEHRPWSRDEVSHFLRRPKEEVDYPAARALLDLANSFPLSAERIQFSPSGRPKESFFKDVGLPTPGSTGAEGAEDEHKSGSSRENKEAIESSTDTGVRSSGENRNEVDPLGGSKRRVDSLPHVGDGGDSEGDEGTTLGSTTDVHGPVDNGKEADASSRVGSCEVATEVGDRGAKRQRLE